MSLGGFIVQSARHYWRGHLGLLFGAFLASAILTGSLLVGDSVRASLRRVAEFRLGQIQSGVLGGDRWNSTPASAYCRHNPLLPSSRPGARRRTEPRLTTGVSKNPAAACCMPAIGRGKIRRGRVGRT